MKHERWKTTVQQTAPGVDASFDTEDSGLADSTSSSFQCGQDGDQCATMTAGNTNGTTKKKKKKTKKEKRRRSDESSSSHTHASSTQLNSDALKSQVDIDTHFARVYSKFPVSSESVAVSDSNPYSLSEHQHDKDSGQEGDECAAMRAGNTDGTTKKKKNKKKKEKLKRSDDSRPNHTRGEDSQVESQETTVQLMASEVDTSLDTHDSLTQLNSDVMESQVDIDTHFARVYSKFPISSESVAVSDTNPYSLSECQYDKDLGEEGEQCAAMMAGNTDGTKKKKKKKKRKRVDDSRPNHTREEDSQVKSPETTVQLMASEVDTSLDTHASLTQQNSDVMESQEDIDTHFSRVYSNFSSESVAVSDTNPSEYQHDNDLGKEGEQCAAMTAGNTDGTKKKKKKKRQRADDSRLNHTHGEDGQVESPETTVQLTASEVDTIFDTEDMGLAYMSSFSLHGEEETSSRPWDSLSVEDAVVEALVSDDPLSSLNSHNNTTQGWWRKVMTLFKEKGVTLDYVSGTWSVSERRQFNKNVDRFREEHILPCLEYKNLVGLGTASLEQSERQDIRRFVHETKFRTAIAAGLRRRLRDVYVYARTTSLCTKTDRYDVEEAEIVEKHHQSHGNTWRDLEEDLDRSAGSARHHIYHKTTTGQRVTGKWTDEEEVNFKMYFTLFTGLDDASATPTTSVPWQSIAAKVGSRTGGACRKHWNDVYQKANKVHKVAGTRVSVQDKVKLLSQVEKQDIDHQRDINWFAIETAFERRFNIAKLKNTWQRMKRDITNYKDLPIQEIVAKLWSLFERPQMNSNE